MAQVSLTSPGEHTARRTSPISSRLRALTLRHLAVFVAACAASLSVVSVADATPKPSVASVQKQVDQLQHDAEAATEKYNATREKLKNINVMAKAAATRLSQQKTNVQRARAALGKLAAETYKAGDLQALSVLLDDNPEALLTAGGLMTTLTDRQADAVARLVAEQKVLADDQAEVVAQQKQLTDATKDLSTLSSDIKKKLAKAQELLSQLKGTERAAIQRASQALDPSALRDLGVQVPDSGALSCDDVGIDAPDAQAAKAISFACAQLGKPYLWGGDGPGSYDCSGLTMQAYGAAGVSLPHNAAMQAQYGKRVAVGSLQPGDLIFFHSGLTHMGMYIGKGLMIHAPHSGDVVRIASARLSTVVVATRI
jgi:cell wall-associated NlpC family hydrolase